MKLLIAYLLVLTVPALAFDADSSQITKTADGISGDDNIENLDDFALQAQESQLDTNSPDGFVVRLEDYGALGDGVTDDTDAFYAAAQAIKANGGGTLVLKTGKNYRVGKQAHISGQYPYYQDKPMFKIEYLNGKVTVLGNNATIKVNDGLHYGSFDPDTGKRYDPNEFRFTKKNYRAAIGSVLFFRACDEVVIKDLEIDGNINGLILGGEWNRDGRQVAADGILLYSNKKVTITNVHTHHHGEDGIMIGWPGTTPISPVTPHYLENVISEYNGRQALSWVGGNGLKAVNCKFNHTGRAREDAKSGPCAGLDIEGEKAYCMNGLFIDCEFVNNINSGVAADSGDSLYSTFENCLIWGTTSWSGWLKKPGLVFNNCTFYGAVAWPYGSSVVKEATKFNGCHFEDYTGEYEGKVYGSYINTALIQISAENVTLDSCTLIANQTPALYCYENDKNKIITNCKITHKADNLSNGTYQSQLGGVTISNTHFYEELDANSYFISVGNTVVGPNVIVDGPRCKWGSTSGLTGTIPQGSY